MRNTKKVSMRGSKNKVMLLGIRNKIVVCFLVPILFMIIVGFCAYQKAQAGMSEKFTQSTTETIVMGTRYVDMATSVLEADALKYALEEDVNDYVSGHFKKSLDVRKAADNIESQMFASQSGNKFIKDIHIVTAPGTGMFSTNKSVSDGLLEVHLADLEGRGLEADMNNIKGWIDSHPVLDEKLSLSPDGYLMAYQMPTKKKDGLVVIDLKKEKIQELIDEIDLGDHSLVCYITNGGKEVYSEKVPSGGSASYTPGTLYTESFFTKAMSSEKLSGSSEVMYAGQKYYFFYSRSESTGAMLCGLVPEMVVVGQADAIKTITVALVILAIILAGFIGILTTAGILKNMNTLTQGLEQVSGGDLSGTVSVKGRDEFRSLASSMNNMISNNKKLVNKVSEATDQLAVSAEDVKSQSEVINDYSSDITQAIGEISKGMVKQSQNAQECVDRTDALSKDIEEVAKVVERVEGLVVKTNELIKTGMDIVEKLGLRAKETSDITAQVGYDIDELGNDIGAINEFVEMISDISEETNLLSLNASIEAARAGESGRGFAVVAEQIRKLADDSAMAASQISQNVDSIKEQTDRTVGSARTAEGMVDLQSEAVTEVVNVFNLMKESMASLVSGLGEINERTKEADAEKSETIEAVKRISEIIEETANNADVVSDNATKLLNNVSSLNVTANALGDNMNELKSEVAVFKTV
ncbi:MAG: methyl-accepting chemotaxis protein [Lachnospiraceae bacterium]|nr:methyl-accepting chemotaxis protein [Candidatus Colinaster equi]